MSTRSELLQVTGARLYYEARGAGPVLLLIPGGPTDAGIFQGLVASLQDRYTVVAYDPRGNSRSVVEGPREDQRLDLHGDDAAALLAALGGGPAHVMGSSGGAQIGLNLAARHPGRVRTLVAHEPPCVGLLPDAAEQRAFMQSVHDSYRAQGIGPAMHRFQVGVGLDDRRRPAPATPAAPSSPEAQQAFARVAGNLDFFLAHGVRPLSSYLPDVDRLRTGSTRVVVGVGEASAGQLAHRTALALAERLGSAPVTFPGDHTGYVDQSAAFAQKLHEVLQA